MSWLKVDDNFPEHPKVLCLKDAEIGAWLRLACWCARIGNDGAMSHESAVKKIGKSSLAKLIKAGLLDEVEGGLQMHDFTEYNPTAQSAEELRLSRIEAGRIGGLKSAAKRQASASSKLEAPTKQVLEANEASASSTIQPPSPSRPLPVPRASGEALEAPPVLGSEPSLADQAADADERGPFEWSFRRESFSAAFETIWDGWKVFAGRTNDPVPRTFEHAKPLLLALASGRTPEEIRDALKSAHPQCWARGKGPGAALKNLDGLAHQDATKAAAPEAPPVSMRRAIPPIESQLTVPKAEALRIYAEAAEAQRVALEARNSRLRRAK